MTVGNVDYTSLLKNQSSFYSDPALSEEGQIVSILKRR